MRLNGRRESTNVDDRRGQKVAAGGIGLAGIVLIAVFTFMRGGNLGDVLQQVVETQAQPGMEQSAGPVDTSATDELAHFSKQILAGTEDVWTRLFQEYGLGEYKSPKASTTAAPNGATTGSRRGFRPARWSSATRSALRTAIS